MYLVMVLQASVHLRNVSQHSHTRYPEVCDVQGIAHACLEQPE